MFPDIHCIRIEIPESKRPAENILTQQIFGTLRLTSISKAVSPLITSKTSTFFRFEALFIDKLHLNVQIFRFRGSNEDLGEFEQFCHNNYCGVQLYLKILHQKYK